MSWHCPICGECTEKKPWVTITVSPIFASIPFTFVIHLTCLRNVVSRERNIINGKFYIREGCDSLDDNFCSMITDFYEKKEEAGKDES